MESFNKVQNKFKLIQVFFGLLCIVFICFVTIKTVAYFFVQTKSEVNTFSTSEWVPAKTSVALKHQNAQGQILEYVHNEKITSYNDQNGEHFQLTITENENQFLSFQYKIMSQETAQKFDIPGVIVFANQTPILQLAFSEYSDEWYQGFIDLTLFQLDPGKYDILFIPQNTYDDLFEPSISIKEVTTTTFFPNLDSIFQFTPDKHVSSMFVEYRIQDNGQEIIHKEELAVQTDELQQVFEFSVPNSFYGSEFSFWSVDLFGNTEQSQYINLRKPISLEVSHLESQFFTETQHELYIQNKFENGNTSPKFFDSRISQAEIQTEQDWEQATKLQEKQYQQFFKAQIPTIYSVGRVVSNLVFENIPEGQQFLSVKICDPSSSCEYIIHNKLIEYLL